MKSFFENSLFGNPVGWSRSAVGSWWRFGIMMGAHIFFCIIMGSIFYDDGKMFYLIGVIMFSLLFPFYYLYALRRLLIMIENNNHDVVVKK